MIIDLSFKKLKMGSKVKTKAGFVWIKIAKDTWEDESSGLVWFPEKQRKYNHYEAEKLQTNTKRLPTKEELIEAKKHGIREILDMYNKLYWSSSVRPEDSALAYYFFGENGYVGVDVRTFNDGSVLLCRKQKPSQKIKTQRSL